MAIVRMKHLRLVALTSDRENLLFDLSKLGAVEISTPKNDEWSEKFTLSEANTAKLYAERSEVEVAMGTLAQYAKLKRGMFAERKRVSDKEFFDNEVLQSAIYSAREINDLSREIANTYANEARLENKKEALSPWRNLDIPLESKGSKRALLEFGTIPAKFNIETVKEICSDAILECISSDREQHYVVLIAHTADEEKINEALRGVGFSKTPFKDAQGTVKENIAKLDAEISELKTVREECGKKISDMVSVSQALDMAYDALSVKIAKAEAQEKLLESEKTVMLTGWFPEREEKRLLALFENYGAAYEIRDPNDDEEPPILTYNSKMVAPYEMITNMYSPPAYRGIDPNPFMAPFFAVFFGIMFSDAAYGILLTLVGAIVLLKFKPRGGVKQMMSMAVMCGITTFIWGVLFGGFFGDAIPTAYKLFTGNEFTWNLALWFNPLDDPMLMLIFSFALGGIHIFAGMAVKAYMMIRDGHLLDAIFDIGSWWVLFGGIIFALVGLTDVGLILIGVGALALLLTQGRHEKKFLKKITSGLASLYDITSYLGDILSYSRLLALSLATAVIASVINTMGAMTGPIGFVVVFLIGHTFNIAVNLIGTYVHTSRLQYVEFFGKFYEGGGEIFSPLDTKTKYVDIVKEEK